MQQQAISLEKGGNVSLAKTAAATLTVLSFGASWDARKTSGSQFDLDLFALCLNADNKAISDQHLLFFNSRKNAQGKLSILNDALIHTGDNLTGAGDGDDEVINVDLSKIPQDVASVLFGVNIYQGTQRNQNFGMVQNAKIRVFDPNNPQATIIDAKDLTEDASTETIFLFGSLYRNNGEWKVKALGQGYKKDYSQLLEEYGLRVQRAA